MKHKGTFIYSRGKTKVNCSCGWQSLRGTDQQVAFEHREHIKEARHHGNS